MIQRLKHASAAVAASARRKVVPALLLLVLLGALMIFLWTRIFVTILPGEAGIKWRRFGGGTQTDYVYAEGMHYMYPWDKMYIYNVRVQQTAHDFDVLTVNGMKIHLSISIRYQPEYSVLGLLHQQVGMDYVNKLVIPEIESVLRIIIGKIAAHEVYTTKTSLIEEAVGEGIEQVAQRYVKIDDVIIKKVQLPQDVEATIQYKIQQKHLAEAYEFKLFRERQEAERKRIEAAGIRDYNSVINLSLNNSILQWKAILATLELAKSPNAKVVVIGNESGGLPILGSIPMDYTPDGQAETPDNLSRFESPGSGDEFPAIEPENEPGAPPAETTVPDVEPSAEEPGEEPLPPLQSDIFSSP